MMGLPRSLGKRARGHPSAGSGKDRTHDGFVVVLVPSTCTWARCMSLLSLPPQTQWNNAMRGALCHPCPSGVTKARQIERSDRTGDHNNTCIKPGPVRGKRGQKCEARIQPRTRSSKIPSRTRKLLASHSHEGSQKILRDLFSPLLPNDKNDRRVPTANHAGRKQTLPCRSETTIPLQLDPIPFLFPPSNISVAPFGCRRNMHAHARFFFRERVSELFLRGHSMYDRLRLPVCHSTFAFPSVLRPFIFFFSFFFIRSEVCQGWSRVVTRLTCSGVAGTQPARPKGTAPPWKRDRPETLFFPFPTGRTCISNNKCLVILGPSRKIGQSSCAPLKRPEDIVPNPCTVLHNLT